MNDLWAVEYSVEQGAFHVSKLRDSVSTNRKLIRSGYNPSFVCIGIAHDCDEAHELADLYRQDFIDSILDSVK